VASGDVPDAGQGHAGMTNTGWVDSTRNKSRGRLLRRPRGET
jgi:hypothetical protein